MIGMNTGKMVLAGFGRIDLSNISQATRRPLKPHSEESRNQGMERSQEKMLQLRNTLLPKREH